MSLQMLKSRLKLVPRWVWAVAGVVVLVLLLAAISIPNLQRSRLPSMQKAPGLGGPTRVELAQVAVDKPAGDEAPSLSVPMIIRTASLLLVVSEFGDVQSAVQGIVRKYGGYIGELNVTGPRGAGRSLVARLRIPSDRLNSVVEELKRLGRVEQETQRGEEVTQQYVDLTARLTNARNTEQRLLEILRERTGKISEVLAVEREIARVREEIERTDAQLKNLVKQVQFATVELQVREEYKTPLEVTPRGAGTRLRNATIEGYRSLVETVLGLVLFLLRSGPVLLFWAFILYWPVRFVWRRIRTRRSAKETKTAA